MKIEKTNEDEFVDIEGLEDDPKILATTVAVSKASGAIVAEQNGITAEAGEKSQVQHYNGCIPMAEAEVADLSSSFDENIPTSIKKTEEDLGMIVLRSQLAHTKQQEEEKQQLSTSVPTKRSLWPNETASPMLNRGSLNFSEMFSNSLRGRDHELNNIRHSMSAMRQKENDTIAMIRGASSCSKDTVMFIDQPSNSYIEDDNSYLGNRSLWVSPTIEFS